MAKKKNNKTFRDLVRTTQQGQDKYNKSKFPKVKVSELKDGRKIDLHFWSLHTEKGVNFPGFITEFSDSYISNWNSQNVYGRMDPIPIYENTQRSLSVGFKIVAASIAESTEYQSRLNQLVQMLFPKYIEVQGVKLLNAAPVFRVKFGNFIGKSRSGVGSAQSNGLAGYISDFNVSADLEEGYISTKHNLSPKVWEISFNYNVLHDQTPGFGDDNTFLITSQDYPYGDPSRIVKIRSAGNTNVPSVMGNSSRTAVSQHQIDQKLKFGSPTTKALAQAGVKGILEGVPGLPTSVT
jgi:hypothetical protein